MAGGWPALSAHDAHPIPTGVPRPSSARAGDHESNLMGSCQDNRSVSQGRLVWRWTVLPQQRIDEIGGGEFEQFGHLLANAGEAHWQAEFAGDRGPLDLRPLTPDP